MAVREMKPSSKIAVISAGWGLLIFLGLMALLPFLWPLWAFVGLLAAAGINASYVKIAAAQAIVDRPDKAP